MSSIQPSTVRDQNLNSNAIPVRQEERKKSRPILTYPLHPPVNFLLVPQAPPNTSEDDLTELEKQGLARGRDFYHTGSAYALEHATRPSTIGLVLASNPMALMAWYENSTEPHQVP